MCLDGKICIYRGGGTIQKVGAQITLKPKKWVRKTSIFITWGLKSECAFYALGSAAPDYFILWVQFILCNCGCKTSASEGFSNKFVRAMKPSLTPPPQIHISLHLCLNINISLHLYIFDKKGLSTRIWIHEKHALFWHAELDTFMKIEPIVNTIDDLNFKCGILIVV